jgi:hypothetical protein
MKKPKEPALSMLAAFMESMDLEFSSQSRRIRRYTRSSAALAGIFLAIGFTTSAQAYSLSGKSWPAGSNVVLQLSLPNSLVPLLDGNTSRNSAIAPALDMWNAQMGRMQFGRVMNSTAPSASGDRVNSVVFSSSVFGQAFGTGTLAVTYYHMQGSSLLEADVLFNTAQVFDSYRGPLRFGSNGYAIGDLRRVMLHELGHAIGLNHSSSDAIMSAMTGDREVLSGDDIAGAQAMYGAPIAPPPPPAPTPAPVPANRAKGQVNGDGHGDFVWQNLQTGERVVWFLRNGIYQSGAYLPSVGGEWEIASVADFNADGHADLVWQNRRTGERGIWFLHNGAKQSELHLPTIPVEWQIASAADLNADGYSDIVWQNTRTGQRDVWFLRNGAWIGTATVANVPPEWQIAGAADFNADGFADFVWQNVRTGERVMWFLRDGQYQSGIYLPTVATEWRIAGAADYNGDGYADFVWQNINTGERVMWFLRDGQYQSGIYLQTIAREWDICVH